MRAPFMDLFAIHQLTFEAPNTETFPGLALAYRAAREGGSMPTVFNAANEMAVKLLLQKKIRFVQIPEILEMAMEHHHTIENPDVVQNNHHFFTDLFRDRNGTRIWSFPDCKSERHPCE